MASSLGDSIYVWIVGPYGLINQSMEALISDLPGFLATACENFVIPDADRHPDLILLAMMQANIENEISTLMRQHPQARVLCFSTTWTPELVYHALQAGAMGFLTADLSLGELAAALRQALRGDVALTPDLQRALMRFLASRKPVPEKDLRTLSPREQEVLTLVCEGLSNKQIAQRLYLSVRTVENHLANIYGKLGVHTRTEAAVLALQRGWITPD